MAEKVAIANQNHGFRLANGTHFDMKKGQKFRVDGQYVADIDKQEMVVIHIPGAIPMAIEKFRFDVEETDQIFNAKNQYDEGEFGYVK